MSGYWQIGLIIVLISVLCALIIDKNSVKSGSICYTGFFYAMFSGIRAIQGNAHSMLGESFAEKGASGYIKTIVVAIPVIVVLWILKKLLKERYTRLLYKATAVFIGLELLTIVIAGFTVLWINVILYAIAVIAAFILDERILEGMSENASWLISAIGAWIMIYVLTGPSEIYAFNKKEYSFKFVVFFPYMILFAGLLFLVVVICAKFLFGGKLNKLLGIVIWLDVILSYIQIMFMNSGMNTMMGADDTWAVSKVAGNVIVWCVILLLLLFLCVKFWKDEKLGKIICYSCGIIMALQLLSIVSIVATKDVINEDKTVVTKEGLFTLSDDENIVIIMLDTYGSQMIDYILEEDDSFLEPLKDFTFYSNMKGRYEYTDPSVHFLLTGSVKDEYGPEDNAGSTFLKDIKNYGYDIRLYTAEFLANYFGEGIVSNLSDESVRVEDCKLIEQMVIAGRYRSMPFALKHFYTYSSGDFEQYVGTSNIYSMERERDAHFYNELVNERIHSDANQGKTFSLYHLNGAHISYYLRENMEYDYSSQDAPAQWRASMKIAYEMIDQMKEAGVYNDSTIIIMADHGPNPVTRDTLEKLGINFSDDNLPIFFIKRPMEEHETIITDDSPTSNDVFEGTIIELIDKENENYGPSLWD